MSTEPGQLNVYERLELEQFSYSVTKKSEKNIFT